MLNVSTHRKERAWSLADLSARSGVSVPTIERIERDERRPVCEYDPRISRVIRLANALGVPIDALIRERAHASNLPDAAGPTPHKHVSPGRSVAKPSAPGRVGGR